MVDTPVAHNCIIVGLASYFVYQRWLTTLCDCVNEVTVVAPLLMINQLFFNLTAF
jgi:hypothetical protein